MRNIPLNEADGSEPLGTCLAHRTWLVERYKVDAVIALKYYADALPAGDDDVQEDAKAISHVRECPKCVAWIRYAIPESTLRRQRRLSRYCCAGLFVAVEEADGTNNRIQFDLFRGEDPCWKVDGKWSFISYCPWCGKKLPNQAFITD